MSNELALKREVTPSVWQMINAIVTTSTNSRIEQAVIAKKMLFAYESDLPLSTAINGGLYCVKDRIEAEGNVIRAKIDQLPDYHYKIEQLDKMGCVLSLWRKATEEWPFALYEGEAKLGDWVSLGQASFTEDDAKQAGLLSKDNYQNYSEDMYFNRATSRLYKRFIAWLFSSPIYVRGEIEGTDFRGGDVLEGEIVKQDDIQGMLQSLIKQHGSDVVLDAIGENMPQTSQDIQELAERLGKSND